MRILIAPDKFKGSLSSSEAAAAIGRGFSEGWPQAELASCPLADGGEGTMELLVASTGGKTLECEVTGPLGERRLAPLGILGDGMTAVVEMALASGLVLVPPDKRDPRYTTTAGTGDLIRRALDEGLRRIIVGIGGSATNDGGAGMAAALGVRFLDESGEELPPGAIYLNNLESIDMSGLDPRIRETAMVVASDVTNPLLGAEGATRVYGPQKGASEYDVELLERGLERLAEVVSSRAAQGIEGRPGAGAAGGLGFGLMAFLGALMRPGVDVVMAAVGFEKKLVGCDLVITGEGRLDAQTSYGKTVTGVARSARRHGIPVLALAGEVSEGAGKLHEMGITSLLGIARGPMGLEESMRLADELLADTSRELASLLCSLRSG
ncbi:MAG: glycerate kinase [Actinomycetota bacterium]|nr:glycerate kinase [Actinomycetota bacterium]MDD5668122.1 glycerate kinase [Actinomycetota bacterium]